MTKTKVKVFKTIYHLLNLIIAFAVCYLGSLTLNDDLIAAVDPTRLITWVTVALAMILSEGILSYKIHQIDR